MVKPNDVCLSFTELMHTASVFTVVHLSEVCLCVCARDQQERNTSACLHAARGWFSKGCFSSPLPSFYTGVCRRPLSGILSVHETQEQSRGLEKVTRAHA